MIKAAEPGRMLVERLFCLVMARTDIDKNRQSWKMSLIRGKDTF